MAASPCAGAVCPLLHKSVAVLLGRAVSARPPLHSSDRYAGQAFPGGVIKLRLESFLLQRPRTERALSSVAASQILGFGPDWRALSGDRKWKPRDSAGGSSFIASVVSLGMATAREASFDVLDVNKGTAVDLRNFPVRMSHT